MQAFLAVAACGAIAVPINLRWSIQEAAAALKGVAAELVFVDADLIQKYSPFLAEQRCIVLNASESTSTAVSNDSSESICRQASSPFLTCPESSSDSEKDCLQNSVPKGQGMLLQAASCTGHDP